MFGSNVAQHSLSIASPSHLAVWLVLAASSSHL